MAPVGRPEWARGPAGTVCGESTSGRRHSAAIWHIPEALVTWGRTGTPSPLLKPVPPAKSRRAGPSWPGIFIRQPDWLDLGKASHFPSLPLHLGAGMCGRRPACLGLWQPLLAPGSGPLGTSWGPTPRAPNSSQPACGPGRPRWGLSEVWLLAAGLAGTGASRTLTAPVPCSFPSCARDLLLTCMNKTKQKNPRKNKK